MRDGARLRAIEVGGVETDALVFTGSRTLAAGGAGGDISIFNVFTGGRTMEAPEHHGRLNALAYSPEHRTLAAGFGDGSVVLRSLTNRR